MKSVSSSRQRHAEYLSDEQAKKKENEQSTQKEIITNKIFETKISELVNVLTSVQPSVMSF